MHGWHKGICRECSEEFTSDRYDTDFCPAQERGKDTGKRCRQRYNNRRAGREHAFGLPNCGIGCEKLAAIRKGIRRDIEHAHNEGTIETKCLGAEAQEH